MTHHLNTTLPIKKSANSAVFHNKQTAPAVPTDPTTTQYNSSV